MNLDLKMQRSSRESITEAHVSKKDKWYTVCHVVQWNYILRLTLFYIVLLSCVPCFGSMSIKVWWFDIYSCALLFCKWLCFIIYYYAIFLYFQTCSYFTKKKKHVLMQYLIFPLSHGNSSLTRSNLSFMVFNMWLLFLEEENNKG